MKTHFTARPSRSVRALLVPCLAFVIDLDSASAQQAPNYAPPAGYRQPSRYDSYRAASPNVSQRVGGFVKRLFYGEPQPTYAPPQYSRPASSGRSLDAPPSASRSTPAVASTPPAPTKTKPAPVASSKPKAPAKPAPTTSKPSSKYTPPRIKPESAAPSIQSKPAPQKPQEAPPAPRSEPTPPPTPTYTPPAPTPDAPPALDNKPTPPPNTVASLNNTLPGTNTTELTPAPEPTAPPQKTPAPSTPSSDGQFLVGKKTTSPGRVVSPYPPYQELDVTGLSSGSLALDPTTDKVFQIP
jgi:hypothetical protein